MTEESDLVPPDSRAVEREWERQGRKVAVFGPGGYAKWTERHRFVNRAAMDQAVKGLEIIPCPACIRGGVGAAVEVECTRLAVTMEPNPIADKGQLVNAVCHGCGFQTMWPFKARTTADDITITATEIETQARAARGQMQIAQKLFGERLKGIAEEEIIKQVVGSGVPAAESNKLLSKVAPPIKKS